MGSGSTRKNTDRPMIRTPKEGSGSGGAADNQELADICVPSFDIKIDVECNDGEGATLYANNNSHDVIVEGKVVGKLQQDLSKMVKHCEEEGVVYVGKIISHDKQQYARFQRSNS
jgi:hypothetical protein